MPNPLMTNIKNMENLNQCLVHNMECSPDTLSYRFIHDDSEKTLTYAQLSDEVSKLSTVIRDNAKVGDRVIIAARPGLEFVIAFYACLQSGCIAVPVFPPVNSQMANRFITVIKSASPTLLLSDKQTVAQLKKGLFATRFLPEKIKKAFGLEGEMVNLFKLINRSKIKLIATEDRHAASHHDLKPFAAKPDDIAFLQYTSGSTGNPKGVMLTHGNLLANLAIITRHFDYQIDSHTFSWLPPYHDMGLIAGIIEPLYTQTPATLMSPIDFIYHPDKWMKVISKYRCTMTGGPNFAFELCAKRTSKESLSTLDLSCLCVLANGAEPINHQSISLFYETFCQAGLRKGTIIPCYGLAESSLIVSGKLPFEEEKIIQVDAHNLGQNKVVLSEGSEGIPIVSSGVLYLDTKIVDGGTRQVCQDDEVGEIWIRGESVAKGYYNLPEESDNAFHNALASDNHKSDYLNTGDLGFIHENELYICGRKKDLIIISGQNFYPQDIEHEVAASSSKIRQGNVVAFSKVIDGLEKLIIVAELKAIETEEMVAIIDDIQHNLSLFLHINANHIYFVRPKSIPKTSSGKLQRQQCAQLIFNDKLPIIHHYQQPINITGATSVMTKSSAIWFRQVSKNPESKRLTGLIDLMTDEIKAILSLSENDKIDIHQGFFDMGFDSIKAIQFKSKLEEAFGEQMSFNNDFVFNYPTIHKAATYIIETLFAKDSALSNQNVDETIDEPIAIIGMSGAFPQSATIEQLWTNLLDSKDCVTDIPTSRFDVELYYDSERKEGKMISKRAGTLSDVKHFDCHFFGISPREATFLDPQQRLLLKHTWLAFEEGNIDVTSLKESDTGVFIGISTQDYQTLITQRYNMSELNAFMSTGNALSTASGRLSHYFGFQGPGMSIDTACSSSLVAVNEACRRLGNGECSVAVAAGVNCLLSPDLFISFSAAGMLSDDGKCKTFDRLANGYVRGEGCGVIVLKKLSDAMKDDNTIHAVIKGSFVNQDGASSGLTVPNGNAQQQVIRRALKRAKINAEQVDYVECHGTGTALGDPIEVNSLAEVYGQDRDKPIYIGSIKANIGHLEAAAGIAGLIKTVLCLQHRTIPKQPHFNELNPGIKMPDNTFIADQQIAIEHPSPMLAAISSFGFSGTNVHLVLQQYAPPRPSQKKHRKQKQYLFVLSAKTEATMAQLRKEYQAFLNGTDEWMGDICYTAAIGRSHGPVRLAFIVKDKTELIDKLSDGNIKPIKTTTKHLHNPYQNLEQLREDYLSGCEPDFKAYYHQLDTKYRTVLLPLYPFEEKPYWLKDQVTNSREKLVDDLSTLLQLDDNASPGQIKIYDDNGRCLQVIDDLSVFNKKEAQSQQTMQPSLNQYVEVFENHSLPFTEQSTIKGQWVVYASPSIITQLIDDYHPIDSTSGSPNTALDNKHVLFVYEDNFAELVTTCKRVIESRAFSFTLITSQAYPLNQKDSVNPNHRKAVGFWQSFAYEADDTDCFLLDAAGIQLIRRALLLISYNLLTEKVLLLRDRCYVPRLLTTTQYQQRQVSHAPTRTEKSEHYQFDNQASYLITGGTGGLGLALAEYLVDKGVKHILLISRHQPEQSVQQWMKTNSKQGVHIHHHLLDISDVKALNSALTGYGRSHPPIKGVFHAAGIHQDGLLTTLTQQDFDDVFAAKVKGSDALVDVFQKQSLDFLIFFSSIVSLLGNPGQTNYAAANAYEDGLAHHLREKGVNAISINWGAFAEVGMSKQLGQRLRHFGVLPIHTDDAFAMLDTLINADLPQVAIASMEWSKAAYHNVFYLNQILTANKQAKPEWYDLLVSTPTDELEARLNKMVMQLVTQVLELSDLDELATDQSLFDLGMDSILALELKNKIQLFFGIPLTITNLVVLEEFTVSALTDYLLKALKLDEQTKESKPALANIEDHSLYAQRLSTLRQMYDLNVANIISVKGNLVSIVTDYAQSPALIEQSIKQRVEAFKKIGVYSGADIDQFDVRYQHLLIMDMAQNTIVAGCRLALLKDYINHKALFYSALEYDFERQSDNFLQHSAELSRMYCTEAATNPVSSIISLLKGVNQHLSNYPDIHHIIGSASLPSDTPDAVIDALVMYYTQYHPSSSLSQHIHAKEPFIGGNQQHLLKILRKHRPDTLNALESILSRELQIDFKIPFLFKLYDELKCQFICFAIDREFDDVIDGLLTFQRDNIKGASI